VNFLKHGQRQPGAASREVPPGIWVWNEHVGPQLDDAASAAAGNSWARPARPAAGARGPEHHRHAAGGPAAAGRRRPWAAWGAGLVTTSPAVDLAVIAARPDVTVTRWVRHADVLPHCSAVITHGGHGTVMKAWSPGAAGRRAPRPRL